VSGRTEILVVGAGLAGLSAARHIGGRCSLVERGQGPGGLAVTEWDHGYGFDRTGHLLHLRDPAIRRWVTGLLGDDAIWISRVSRIWSHGVYTRYPYQANTFGLPAAVANECLMGFLEARERSADVEIRSFEDFILAHFGRGFARHFMIPYNRKIWGVHPRQMTSAWCDRFVPIPRLEHVIAGAVGMNEQQMGYNASFLYPKMGIGVLTTRIARDVARKTDIQLGTALTAVDARNRRARLTGGRWVEYDALISTVPLDVLARMLVDPPAAVAGAAKKLRVRSLCYLDVALERPAATPYHWSYVPDPRVPFYRVGSYSNFSADLVPKGCGSLYVELTARNPGTLADVMGRSLPWLSKMGLIRGRRDVRFARLRRIPHGYVIYDHSWHRARATLHDYLKRNEILSIGRYGDWNYSAMEDALIAGRDAARSLAGARS
jgi:protoporphyrinogen oxidase